ncbi:MAG: transcriptional regulator [Methanospirillaceae archaeon]|nr:transcriptional regulator [Methanospirillaceae archaeon]
MNIMRKDNFLEIIHGAYELNSQIISLIRIMILWALYDVAPDGVTARQLKGALQAHEGSLYSNLDALEEMGYIHSQMTRFESKEIKMYTITKSGLDEWKKMSKWFQLITQCNEEEQ